MTLDEAITHAREKAKENKELAEEYWNDLCSSSAMSCEQCAEEHEQLAEWLEELKKYRELQSQIPKWHLVADGDFPKAEESVLLVTKHIGYEGKVYYSTFRGIYEDGTIHSENSVWSWDSDYTDALEYCEETDDYIIGKGWYEESLYNPEDMSYEIDGRAKVIAWMELPIFQENFNK